MKPENSKRDGACNSGSNRKSSNNKRRRQQPRKDSSEKRINLDNERVDKFDRDNPKAAKMYLRKADNDVTWYTRNPELLRSAGSLPFASILGSRNPLAVNFDSVPGIMRIDWTPAFGSSEMYPTALNQAGKSVYSYLVHANSRNYNYEYQDLMIMIVAAAQVYALLARGFTAYGLAKTYLEQNRYMPNDVLTALGWDAESVRTNLGNMWFGLNELISRTNQIWIPNSFPVIARWFWLNSNIFMDATGPRSQIYCFNQQVYFQYNATMTEQGGGLEPVKMSDNMTWEAYYAIASQMIDALINDEDRGMIFGDILNAYGADKIFSLPPISSEHRVAPVFSAEVLSQIENIIISPCGVDGLLQTTEGLTPYWKYYNGTQLSTTKGAPNTAVLNMHKDGQPTPEELAVATRLMALGVEYRDGYSKNPTGTAPAVMGILAPLACGTEIVTAVEIYWAHWDSDGVRTLDSSHLYYPVVSSSSANVYNPNIMAFDWHPFLYYLAVPESSETQGYEVEAAYGDFDNYIFLSKAEAMKIHDACVYSLFGLPIL